MAMYAAALPVLACALLALAGVELVWKRCTGHGLLPWLRRRSGTPISATGFDEFTAVFQGSKRAELQHRQVQLVLREDDGDGALPVTGDRVDLDQGIARITRPGETHDAR
ncbi:DUF6191 domain-containing protein [Actinomadura namibiensis]|uniref:Uncharacterized protein n=1 Tax=Actinomadura namibiensis TaxID=182080 RepID=A0A7W3QRJ9_ACTNM|nr:DUF6191 domain-containing protein [Actinomadura namibiensis]MBA8956834.1 hypothetical protein [Actinomadura namibiensis]